MKKLIIICSIIDVFLFNEQSMDLIYACKHEMKEVALELIKTEHAKPEH